LVDHWTHLGKAAGGEVRKPKAAQGGVILDYPHSAIVHPFSPAATQSAKFRVTRFGHFVAAALRKRHESFLNVFRRPRFGPSMEVRDDDLCAG
jgi:hypothetical protein